MENKTQWNGDTRHWKEGTSRPRNAASGGQVIALLREAGLLLHNTEAFESLNTGFLMPNGEAPSNPPDGQDALERYGADFLSIVLISSEKPARFLTKFPL